MSLNDLPPELTARFVFYLALLEPDMRPRSYVNPKPRLSRYACTSFNLQTAIERHLFSKLSLKSDDLSAFEVTVARSARRRALLQYLRFTPVLPAYDIHACAQFEKPSDQQANDLAFTIALQRLYTILQACDAVEGETPFDLVLDTPFAPSDESHQDWDEAYAISRGWDSENRREVWSNRYEHSYLQLDEQTELATSKRVTNFMVDADGPRYVAPATAITILKSHSNVRVLSLDLQDNERKSPDLRIQLRTDFARRLRDIRYTTLTHLNLSYRYEEPSDQRFVNADVRGIDKASTHDALSTSLHNLLVACPKLNVIDLDGPI
jgi:hypothetical protein